MVGYKRKRSLNDYGDDRRAAKRRRHDDQEVQQRVALEIRNHLEGLGQQADGGDNPDDPLPNPPALPSPPPPPRRPAPARRRQRQPNLVPMRAYPGPPVDDADMEDRIRERGLRLAAKKRLDDLFTTIRDACPGVRVSRALFDRRIKNLVGDQSPDELGIALNAIPASGSPEEVLVVRRYKLARDVALHVRRKSIMDQDITLAIEHLGAP